MNKSLGLLSAITFALLPLYVGASPGPSNEEQINIANQCANEHAMTLDPNLQQQIENTCSASNAGSQFTGSTLSERQMSDIANTLMFFLASRWSHLPRFLSSNPNYSSYGDPTNGQSGINAGDLFGKIGIWSSFSLNTLDNDFVNTPFDSSTQNIMLGADINPMENLIIGVSYGYEDTDVNTLFNGGEQDSNGYTLSGYLGYLFTDNMSVGMAAGRSEIDINQNRIAVAPFPASVFPAGTLVSSEVDVERWFFTANLNGFWQINNWLLGAHGSYLLAEEEHDAFTERGGGLTAAVASRDFDLGQWRFGFDVGYDVKSFLEPYFSVDYLNNTTQERVVVAPGLAQPSNDDDEFEFGIGMRYFGNYGITGDLGWRVTRGRTNIDNNTFMATVRVDL